MSEPPTPSAARPAAARSLSSKRSRVSLASKVREAEAEQGVMIDALLTRFGVMQVRASEREESARARACVAAAVLALCSLTHSSLFGAFLRAFVGRAL